MKKYILFILLFSAALFILQSCRSSETLDDPKSWEYFKILSDTAKDKRFVELQKELVIVPLNRFLTIYVNTSDDDFKYLVLGEVDCVKDRNSKCLPFQWNQISDKMRQFLLNYTDVSKTKVHEFK